MSVSRLLTSNDFLRGLLVHAYGPYVKAALLLRTLRARKTAAVGLSSLSQHWNCVLRDEEEIRSAIEILRKLTAFLHHDRPKNWDLAKALIFVLLHGDYDSAVLEVGCGRWGGMLLPSLAIQGLRQLYGCDPALRRDFRRGPIKYLKRGFFSTGLPPESLQFVISLSVIEHEMPMDRYLAESHRLLVRGGYLLTSTDFWPGSETGSEPSVRGRVDHVFGRAGIESVFQVAAGLGFVPYDEMDFRAQAKLVSWRGASYTFAFLVFRKA